MFFYLGAQRLYVAGGLFYYLVLFGAFVVSAGERCESPTSSRSVLSLNLPREIQPED